MQRILSIVEQVRAHYVARYVESLSSFVAAHSPAAAEALFEIPGEASYPFRLYRADLASNSTTGLKIEEVNVSTHLDFSVVAAEGPNGAQITLHPIAWNGVEFQASPVLNRPGLEAWALRWLDVNDGRRQDENGLQGVVHSVSDPEVQVGSTEFSVDFGSAPAEAFEQLVAMLWSTGSTHVTARSSILDSE